MMGYLDQRPILVYIRDLSLCSHSFLFLNIQAGWLFRSKAYSSLHQRDLSLC